MNTHRSTAVQASTNTGRGRALAVVLVLAFLVRLPFFFHAVIDWDESTFILVGQSVLDGNLPYVQLWDVKPPLLFGFFAAVIGLFGHDLIGVRIAGTLCVAASGYLVYLAVLGWSSPRAALYAAALCVGGIVLLPGGMATMSEHVALPLLLGATYLLLREDEHTASYAWTGALIAAAALIRLNLIYVAVAIGGLVLVRALRKPRRVAPPVAYVCGGLAVLLLTVAPFLLAGKQTALWKAAVVAALARSRMQASVISNLSDYVLDGIGWSSEGQILWLHVFLWLVALLGFALSLLGMSRQRSVRREAGSIAVVSLATTVSILMSGGNYQHYLIQLVPFAAIFAGGAAAWTHGLARRAMWLLAAIAALVSLRPVMTEYTSLGTRLASGQSLRIGPAYEIADYLRRENPTGEPVYLLIDHVAYWLVGGAPPTGMATHPSTLSKPQVLAAIGTTPDAELARVFARMPLFVVLPPDPEFYPGAFRDLLARYLERDYRLVTEIQARPVYRRQPGARPQS